MRPGGDFISSEPLGGAVSISMTREAFLSTGSLDAGQGPDTAELVAVSAMPGMAGVILHGGWAGAPRGERNGNWRNGFYSQQAQAERQRLREMIRQMRATMDELP